MFEIKVIFCAPSGRTGSYIVHPDACPCTPLVYIHINSLKKRAHTGRTAQKNVRPSTEMCAPGAVCTLKFEHWPGAPLEGGGGSFHPAVAQNKTLISNTGTQCKTTDPPFCATNALCGSLTVLSGLQPPVFEASKERLLLLLLLLQLAPSGHHFPFS